MKANAISFLLGGLLATIIFNGIRHLPNLQNHTVIVTKKIVVVKPTITPKLNGSEYGSAAQEYIQQVFGSQAKQAYSIARNASKFNCKYADIKTDSYGLFGISKSNFNLLTGDVNNCIANIDAAKAIYDNEGWKAWEK